MACILSIARNGNTEGGMSGPTSFDKFCVYCSSSYGYDALVSNFTAVLYGIDEIRLSCSSRVSLKKAPWPNEVSVSVNVIKLVLRIWITGDHREWLPDIVRGQAIVNSFQ